MINTKGSICFFKNLNALVDLLNGGQFNFQKSAGLYNYDKSCVQITMKLTTLANFFN